jgi:[ribosomal protein S5]-alanine N-acetyltransferase
MVIAKSERLCLRHFHIADLDQICAVFCDPEVMRFGPGPQSRAWVQDWLRGCLEDYYCKWGFGLWAVQLTSESRVIGFCGLTRFDDIDGQSEIELGYRFARAHWGHGFGTEAAQIVRDYAFQSLGLPRLVSIISAENGPSMRIAEKIGFHHEKDVEFKGKMQRLYTRANEKFVTE